MHLYKQHMISKIVVAPVRVFVLLRCFTLPESAATKGVHHPISRQQGPTVGALQ